MTKGKLLLFSGIFILSSILIQLLKLIQQLDNDKIDGFSGGFFGMGIGFLLLSFFKKRKEQPH